MTIDEAYEYASILHGHKCPGLAIGVRAAEEAKRILKIEDIQDKGLYCVAENSACYLDGIEALIGCTAGKGNLIMHPTGKTAFSFYHTSAGKSVRMVMKDFLHAGDRNAQTDFILHAPLDEVFSFGETSFEIPARKPRGESVICSVCGESVDENYIRIIDGKPLCADCAGKI